VGRTIWWDALRDFANGGGGDRDTAVRAVAARYLDLVRDYQAVRAAT
jgi:myo-inositol catabolism protein IolC